VSASGPDDAWAVGIYREPGEGSADHLELQHWDGTGWSTSDAPSIPSPGEGPSVSAAASAGQGDAWAAGSVDTDRGGVPLALHWDGRSWSVSDMPDTGEPESHLFGAAAISPDDVWAVGGWARPGELQGGGLVLHWDGSRWSSEALPVTSHPASESGGPYDALNAVAGTSSSDVWAVGAAQDVPTSESRTLVFHWDGTGWSPVDSPNVQPDPGTGNVDDSLQAVAAVASDDAWAVGSFDEKGLRLDSPTASRPLALHWDGSTWSVVELPDVGQGGLNGIAALAADDVWAVGQTVVNAGGDFTVTPLLFHWDGSTWSQVAAPIGGEGSLSAVTAIPGGGLWAVGSRGPGSPARALALRCS
jgi:hypothetical protein